MKKTLNKIVLISVSFLVSPLALKAQNGDSTEEQPGGDGGPMDKLISVGTGGGYAEANETTISSLAGTIVGAFLSLLGVIFIILMIYGGYNWMTAGGNEDKMTTAKNTIKSAIIGLIIIAGAWAIYIFISRNFY
jgi:hypothetical protein